MDLTSLITLVQNIEGPYRWYVLGVGLLVVTALFTRFIFKTLKWFLLLMAIAALLILFVGYFVTYPLA